MAQKLKGKKESATPAASEKDDSEAAFWEAVQAADFKFKTGVRTNKNN